MDNLQMKQLRLGLDAVMADVTANPAKLNTLQVLSLLGTVRAQGFHVATALQSMKVRCGKAGLGDRLEEALEDLRDYHVLGLLVNQPEMNRSIRVDEDRVRRSMVVHWGRQGGEGRVAA